MQKLGRPLYFTSLLMGFIAIVGMLSLLTFTLLDSRQEEHRRAQVVTQNLAWALEEHAKAIFEKVDIVLLDVYDQIQMNGLDGRIRGGDPAYLQFQHWLKSLHLSVPETDAVRVTDPEGKILFSSGDTVPDLNVADRSYFLAASKGTYAGLNISEPLISRTSGKPIIVLARRLEFPDGRFAGIVYAPIRLDYFIDFYRSLKLGPKGVVAMRSIAGHREIARFPPHQLNTPIDPKKSPVQPFLDRGESFGTFDVISPIDAVARTSSFRLIGDFPLYIIVGQGKEDYLASWRHKAVYLSLGVVLLSLLVGFMTWQVWRGQRRDHKNTDILERAQTVAHIGSWELDLVHNQLRWSVETYRIFGVSGDAPLTYQAFLAQVHPDDRTKVEIAWQNALKGEPYDIEHRIIVHGTVKWVHEMAVVNFDARNRPISSIGTVHDITGHKLDEERNRLAASVFSNSHDGIVITDPGNRIIEVNQAFCEVTGYSREEVLGRNPSMLNSGQQDPAFYQAMWQSLRKTGHWSGEIWNRKKSGEPYVELLSISAVQDAHGYITHYVGAFSDITSLKSSQQRLEHLAHFDPLTHLPNRTLLADRLQQSIAHAERQEKLLAVCFIDLDGFKPINDKYGHETGDRLLVEVGNRLKGMVRTGDTVARLGGDEFVLLLTDINEMDEMEDILSRLLLTLAAPYNLAGEALRITASIGVTVFPLDGSDPDMLIRHADQAMYSSKQAGRNRYHMFDSEHDRLIRAKREHLDRLREALKAGELRLYYQPKVNLRTGQVVGAEALIRWQHPERGLLLPFEFLPLVEENELIVDIGEWVLREALQQLQRWSEAGLQLQVSVNIAIHHLQHTDFMPRLERILAEFPGVSPHQLELEILETAALSNMAHAQMLIEACRRLGVGFALDDFGTGYSSLSYLQHLPADTLKIDKSFVIEMLKDPVALAIVEGVIGMTTAFQRKVIAEGVESVEHGVMLMQLGCDLVQGYGIARPMRGEEMPQWVQQFHPDPAWLETAPLHWNREEYPLLTVGVDHKRWVENILQALEEPSSSSMPEQISHHHCRFGQWYYGIGMKYYGDLPEFKLIESLHMQVHDLGKEIILLRDSGKRDQARTLARQLVSARDLVLEKLTRLQLAVALNNDRQAGNHTRPAS